jgi:hypothetical protein
MKRSDGPLRKRFLAGLAARGMEHKRELPDGRHELVVDGAEIVVSLDNVSRDFARDGDVKIVDAFLDRIVAIASGGDELPAWKTAKRGLRFAIESADCELGDSLRERLSPMLVKALVYTDAEESRISFLTQRHLKRWKVSESDAVEAANANMTALMEQTSIEVEEVAGGKLAMFATHSPFKASLVLAPNFKERVESKVGWPVLAVAPCRDFLYALAEKDQELVGRLGTVVLREYRGSGYPLSTEVLRCSDEGIEALGRFDP